MRTWVVIFFALRLLLVSAVIYNFTRLLPTDPRSRIRYRNSLRGARLVADFCLHRGGIFLKAAQYLSTISNLFDAEFTEIFAGVPDRAAPRPYNDVRYRFRAEFDAEPEDLFLEFDREPLAAASLGQVHVGRIRDGRKVAIKFLHPRMEYLIRKDLRALRYVVGLIQFFYGHLNFTGHLTEFSNMIQMEIDYENEAQNMRRVRDNFHDDPRFVIPNVIEEFSRSTVLTTEYIEGIPLNDNHQLEQAGVNRRTVTELLVEAYARMIFQHRFYHADPHAGNIFVVISDAMHPVRLAFVDFGATQMVTERMIGFVQRAIEIMRARDIRGLVELFYDVGMLHPDADRETYTNLAEMIYARYSSFKLEEHYRINPVRFGRILKVRDLSGVGLRLRDVISHARLPRRYIYLGRTLTLILSQSARLDEQVNVFRVARPHIDKYLGLKSRGIVTVLRRRGFGPLLDRLQNGPAAQNSLVVRDAVAPGVFYTITRQVLFAVTGLGFAGIAAYLHTYDLAIWSERSLIASGVAFALMMWNMWRAK